MNRKGIFLSHSHTDPDKTFIVSLYNILKCTFYGYDSKDIINNGIIYCSSVPLQESDRSHVISSITQKKTEIFFLFATHNSMNSPSVGWEKGFYEGFYQGQKRASVIHFGITDFNKRFYIEGEKCDGNLLTDQNKYIETFDVILSLIVGHEAKLSERNGAVQSLLEIRRQYLANFFLRDPNNGALYVQDLMENYVTYMQTEYKIYCKIDHLNGRRYLDLTDYGNRLFQEIGI